MSTISYKNNFGKYYLGYVKLFSFKNDVLPFNKLI